MFWYFQRNIICQIILLRSRVIVVLEREDNDGIIDKQVKHAQMFLTLIHCTNTTQQFILTSSYTLSQIINKNSKLAPEDVKL